MIQEITLENRVWVKKDAFQKPTDGSKLNKNN